MANVIRKRKTLIGSETLNQVMYLDNTGSQANTGDILAPGDVITTDASAAGVLVGKGSIVRIQVSADTYVAFGESTIAAVSSTTTPGLKLAAGYYLVCATDDYLRASAALTRLEVMHRG